MGDYQAIRDLEIRYRNALDELEKATDRVEGLYKDKTEKEHIYIKAKAVSCARLLREKTPVTVIKQLIDGETDSQWLNYKLADGILKSEFLNIRRLEKLVDGCQSVLSVEKSLINIK